MRQARKAVKTDDEGNMTKSFNFFLISRTQFVFIIFVCIDDVFFLLIVNLAIKNFKKQNKKDYK